MCSCFCTDGEDECVISMTAYAKPRPNATQDTRVGMTIRGVPISPSLLLVPSPPLLSATCNPLRRYATFETVFVRRTELGGMEQSSEKRR